MLINPISKPISSFLQQKRLPGGVFMMDTPYPCAANVLRLDRNALPVINRMTRNGILIDKAAFNKLDAELSDALLDQEATLLSLLGREINPGSPIQISDLVYGDLGLIPLNGHGQPELPPKTFGGRAYSTDDEYLSKVEHLSPVVGAILKWRELQKLQSTYVRGIASKADSDERVRCRWNYAFVDTGRLSSAEPNMQNWPAQNPEWAERIRGGFIPKPGCKLISHDLSQIEMRMGAHESKDPKLVNAFWNNLDTHAMTAAYVFHEQQALTDISYAISLVDKKSQRNPCKAVNFGIFYGQTAEGLQVSLLGMGIHWTIEQCQALIDRWYEIYNGVLEYLERTKFNARRYGMVWDIFGRARPVPEIHSALNSVISAGLRVSGNTPIQSGAQGIIKIGMYVLGQVYDHYTSAGYHCEPLLQIHDEMISEVSVEIAEDFALLGKDCLENCIPPFLVPIECGYGVGDTWGQLK